MPRKPTDPIPAQEESRKMTDEARKAIFGASEKETAPDSSDARGREHSSPSTPGRPDSAGSDRSS
jgi:hypothetical protein